MTEQMMEERVITKPVKTDDGDHDTFAHYLKKDDHGRGYILGEEVEALCGKKWVPTKDPTRYPICPTCKEIFEGAFGEGATPDE
jgi:hypothetical protein